MNPYQSPSTVDSSPETLAPPEEQARRYVRRAGAVLFVPAAVNGATIALGAGSFFPVAAIANLAIVAAAFAGVWLFGLQALNVAALMFYGVFGGSLTRQAWLDRMHESLWPLPWAAGVGAIIWLSWMAIFFGLERHDLSVNLAFAALGHLAAAWVYLTVFFGWYRLRRAAVR